MSVVHLDSRSSDCMQVTAEPAALASSGAFERMVYLDDLPPAVNWVETSQPLCIDVIGMAQAGKSTFCKIIDRHVRQQGAPGGNFNFPVSNGFRGITAHIVEAQGMALDEPVMLDADTYRQRVDAFLDAPPDLRGLMRETYVNPADEDTVLRSPAVNSVVAWTSEHPAILPLLHEVGGAYLGEVIRDPSIAGLTERPATILMDARNRKECQEKYLWAGLQETLAVVLECPEDIAAQRAIAKRCKDLPHDSEEFAAKVAAETVSLQRRNQIDRARSMGKMTLAEDIERPYYLHELVWQDGVTPPDQESPLIEAGWDLAYNPACAVVVRTNRMSREDEAYGLEVVLNGVLERAAAKV